MLTLNPLRMYRRWRHGRGFGVHSPFAYHFITEVLRQPLPYYSYARIGGRTERTIFRITAFLRPATVAVAAPRQVREAIALAVPRARIIAPGEGAADLLVVDAEMHPDISAGAAQHAVIINPEGSPGWRTLCGAMERGMTFAGGGILAVAVALPHLPRQHFEVNF